MNDKQSKYSLLVKQVKSFASAESDRIALMANVSALIHDTFHFWWTGFYRVIGGDLVLGPFQGPLACTRIAYGKGVCGSAWKQKESIVVPDVEQFPGHIACSSISRSEIVVPVWEDGMIVAVLDIDSENLNTFDDIDRFWLERIVRTMMGQEKEIFLAGGCFWGMEHYFKLMPGVIFTEVGFANGNGVNPSYKLVYTDTTGFAETVHLLYNPKVLPLDKLLKMYFVAIDPTSLNRQGEDEGTRYRTGIYYTDNDDLTAIETEMKRIASQYAQPIKVEVCGLKNFYPAEPEHQDYLSKNPNGYCHLPLELFEMARGMK